MQNALKGRMAGRDYLPDDWRTPHGWWEQYDPGIEALGYSLFDTDRGGVQVAEVQRWDEDELERFEGDGAVYAARLLCDPRPIDLLALYLDGRPTDVRVALPGKLRELLEAGQ